MTEWEKGCGCDPSESCAACIEEERATVGPGCERHQGDPHNLCEACWALEPDPATLTVTQGGIGDTAGFFLPPEAASQMDSVAKRVVVSFTLPSNEEHWHWPLEGEDSLDAFVEILDRANIPWTVRDA